MTSELQPDFKITVITAVMNNQSTIGDAIDSVASQEMVNIEHIVVDGMSNDGTETIIADRLSKISQYIREPDDGMYDALNKGIRASTGDVVGFLHADDLFASPSVLSIVRDKFLTEDVDAVYGDLVYVDCKNTQKIIRYWVSGQFDGRRFYRGWMPPHPTVYVKKRVYEKFGGYLPDFGSAADYECMVRLMVLNKIKVGYIQEVINRMRVGGTSNQSLLNRIIANRDDRRAWLANGLKPPFALRFTKPLSKFPQYFKRPKKSDQSS